MQQEVLHKIHSENYESSINFDDYIQEVSLGLQLINNDGLDAATTNPRAVNMALEYNMELMMEQLLA